MKNKTANIYTEWLPLVNSLTDADAGKIFKSILLYQNDDPVECDNPIWHFIRAKLDDYNKDRRNLSNARAIAGKKGAEAKASKSKQRQAKASNCQNTQSKSATNVPAVIEPIVDNKVEKINSLEKLKTYKPENDIQFGEWCNKNGITNLDFVYNKIEDLILFCESNGRKYKDYKATLQNWLKKDKQQQDNLIKRMHGAKSLFEVGSSNDDLDWESN